VEITPSQNVFLTRLWNNNPSMLPKKKNVVFRSISWLYGPILLGTVYWCYYINSSDWARFALSCWLWFTVISIGVAIAPIIVRVRAALNASSLEDRKKYDLLFLSYESIGSINVTYPKLYNNILSAILVGLCLFIGLYYFAVCMIIIKFISEWYRISVKKYVRSRLEEISKNLYVY